MDSSLDNITFDNTEDTLNELDSLDIISLKKRYKSKKKKINKYNKEYSKVTLEYYKSCRIQKIDPISFERLDKTKAFKFKYMWDPYTGERLNKDPYGALYFHPDNLIRHFYFQRLNKLWILPDDTDAGYYEGSYDDAIGIGKEFLINNTYKPEWNIFRLPIPNCYLTNDNKMQYLTFGPELTDSGCYSLTS